MFSPLFCKALWTRKELKKGQGGERKQSSFNFPNFYINLVSVGNLENFENQIRIPLPFINDYTPNEFLQTVENHIFLSKSWTLH